MEAFFSDRFDILGPVGRGGFGTIYEATQRTTGQPVAIKVMRAGGPGVAARRLARFEQEARLCARLQHPNIVRLLDSGRTPDGTAYLVFEWVPGCNLSQVLEREGALAPREAIRLMGQVLDALACSHELGVVHRDLKPSNIMVIPTGARRNALVLDFGIGALLEGPAEHNKITGSNELLGTPSYAAPEQLRGHPPTPRSDLYAWGLVFLETLTGRGPFEGLSLQQILVEQLSQRQVPIPIELGRHAAGALISRATVKDPSARVLSAAELLEELERLDIDSLALALSGSVKHTPSRSLVAASTEDGSAIMDPRSPMRAASKGSSAEPQNADPTTTDRRQVAFVTCLIVPVRLVPRDQGEELEAQDGAFAARLALCEETARRFAGRLVGAFGDRALLAFGHEEAHEHNARNAARAAFEIASALKGSDVLEPARLGLHIGMIVARHGSPNPGDFLGQVPTLSARLAALALPGSVAVSSVVKRMLYREFTLEPLSHDAELGPVYALLNDSPTFDRSLLRTLVGREHELALLEQRWSLARGGHGVAILVTGEAGIGKSRLLNELRGRFADQAHRWLDLQCSLEARHSALQPIVDWLLRFAATSMEASVEDRQSKLVELLQAAGLDPIDGVPLLGPLLGLPPSQEYSTLEVSPQKRKEMTFNAIIALWAGLAEQEPLVIAVEDVHWADPTTLELLARLVGVLEGLPILLWVNARPAAVAALTGPSVLQIRLERLEDDGVKAMAESIAGGKALDAKLVRLISERTDGVPLFVEEFVYELLESGLLIKEDQGWNVRGSALERSIPDSLRQVFTARLDRLGEARAMAHFASVLGRSCDKELLLLAWDKDETDAEHHIATLVEAGLLLRRHRLHGVQLQFRHALLRDAAYDAMLSAQRKQAHLAIAEALQRRFPERVRAQPGELARHLAGAERYREALSYASQAAGMALSRSANFEAIGYIDEALPWVARLQNRRDAAKAELALHALLAPALMNAYGWTNNRIKDICERSLARVDEVEEADPNIHRTLWSLWVYHHVKGDERETALRLAEQLLARAQTSGQRVAAHTALGHSHWMDGDYADAIGHFDTVLALYDPAHDRDHAALYGQDTRSWTAGSYAQILWLSGWPERAEELLAQSLEWARETKHAGTIALTQLFACVLGQWEHDAARVSAAFSELAVITDRYGLPAQMAYAGVEQGWAVGDPEIGARCLAGLAASGSKMALYGYHATQTETEASLGRFDVALERIVAARRASEQMKERYFLSNFARIEAGIRRARGEPDQALGLLDEAIEIATRQGLSLVRLQAALDRTELFDELGQGDRGLHMLEEAVAAYPSKASHQHIDKARNRLRTTLSQER